MNLISKILLFIILMIVGTVSIAIPLGNAPLNELITPTYLIYGLIFAVIASFLMKDTFSKKKG